MKNDFHRIFVILLLIGVAIYSLWELSAPSLKVGQEESSLFSAHRVYSHLENIAREPHPTGSKGNDRVREYIINAALELGYNPQVQTAAISVSAENSNLITSATIHNVLIRVQGSASSGAVLVSGHYDSEAGSYGANDDGVAVAAMLETLRVLKESEKLKNDVIFLFTDGEELGLFGARTFWKEHAWSKDVSVVLNYEARGSKGSSLMFETGKNNGWIIENFAEAASHPISNSSMSDFYELMTNDTDFTIAREYEKMGLNFAYGDGRYTYHSPLDNLDHVDLRTVGHHGNNVYNLVKQFGHANLSETVKSDKVFFNLFGSLIHYPKSWTLPLMIFISIMILSAVAWRLKVNKIAFRQLGLAYLFITVTIALLAGVLLGTWKLLDIFWTDDMFRYQLYLIFIAFMFLSLSLFALSYHAISHWVNVEHLYPAVLLFNVLLVWGCYIYLPEATYLIIWPFIIHYLFYLATMHSKEPLISYKFIHTAASGLCLLFFIPILFLLIVFLPISFIPYIAASAGIIGFWIFPSLVFATNNRFKYTALGSFILSLCAMGLFHLNVQVNSTLPERNNLFYVQHTDLGKSFWVSKTKPDSWTKAYLSDPQQQNLNDMIIFNGSKQTVWTDKARTNQLLKAPHVKVLKNQKHKDFRELELLFRSGREAQDFFMIEVLDAKVIDSEIQGEIPDYREAREKIWNWRMRYYGVPDEGVRLKLKLEETDRISLRVMDGTYGLPTMEGLPPRPSHMIGRYEYDHMTLVMRNMYLELQ